MVWLASVYGYLGEFGRFEATFPGLLLGVKQVLLEGGVSATLTSPTRIPGRKKPLVLGLIV